MKILAIIQARVGASRLPNKVLLDLEGSTVLEHIVSRVRNSKLISDVIVATTVDIADLAIVRLCAEKNIRVFCGSEVDVLDRFYQIAKLLYPDHIVRITADCPVIDSNLIDEVIELHISKKADYTSNILVETYPDGEDIEVFTYSTLRKTWENSGLKSEREHVTPYIKKHPELFSQFSIENEIDLSKERWTLDYEEDYELIKILYRFLYKKNKYFGIREIVDFLKKNPKFRNLNSHIERNEGYCKSIIEDIRLLDESLTGD